MGEPINQCDGHSLVVEDLSPCGKGQVGGDDQRHPRMLARAELERQLGALFSERYEPEFVDNLEFLFLGLLDEPGRRYYFWAVSKSLSRSEW